MYEQRSQTEEEQGLPCRGEEKALIGRCSTTSGTRVQESVLNVARAEITLCSGSSSRDIVEGELLTTSTTLKISTSFLSPVTFPTQKNQLLPASALKHYALRASDNVFGQWFRNVLHTRPLSLVSLDLR